MPADRFALAVGVGREDQAVGLLRRVRNFLQPLRLVGIELPLHCKAVVGIDRPVLGRQIADVAIAGEHLEIAAERSEEHTSELQSLMRHSYAVFCLKKKNTSTA